MSLSGLVLAGGASTRMGFDKARAPMGGWPLAVRMAENLGCVCERVWLVRRGESDGWPWLCREGRAMSVLREPERADRHPLFGVAYGLANVTTSEALIVPCDVPRMSAALVRRMAERGPCVVWDGQAVHPLCAVLPASWAERALSLALQGGAARQLVKDLPRVEASPDELQNVNTWREVMSLPENDGILPPDRGTRARLRQERGVLWPEPE